MFANLIESDSHRKELKRRSSFFLATIAAYTVILFAAAIVSIYTYDARLEAQTSSLELLNWVPPVMPETPRPRETQPQPNRRSNPSNAPRDPNIRIPIRAEGVAPTNDPTKVPDHPGTQASAVPPVVGVFRQGTINADPAAVTDTRGCATCSGTESGRVVVDTPPPAPTPVKHETERVTSVVLVSKAISLPQPVYPPIARQIGAHGTVLVQILVDENGKVLTAQSVSGHPTLLGAAKEAALRARFTPTVLNGVPVKIQGVITYNFILQ